MPADHFLPFSSIHTFPFHILARYRSCVKYGTAHKLNRRKNCWLYLPIFKAHEIFSCLAFHTGRQLLRGVSASFYQGMMQSGNKVTQPWHHRFWSAAGRGRKPRFCRWERIHYFMTRRAFGNRNITTFCRPVIQSAPGIIIKKKKKEQNTWI